MSDTGRGISHGLAAALIALTVALIAGALLDRDLINGLETGYALTVQGMTRDGHWIVPYQNGVPRVVKPPLPFWIGALACEACDAPSAPMPVLRAVSALMAILSMLAVYGLGASLFNRRAGLWAALMWATSVACVYEYRYARHDIYLAAAVALTMWSAWRWIRRRRGGWALTLVGLVLAFQIKGPVSWVLTALPVIVYVLAYERTRWRIIPGLVGGMVLSAVSLLPWIMLMLRSVPYDLRPVYMWEALGRFRSATAPDKSLFYYASFAGFVLPWLPFFAGGLVAPFKPRAGGDRAALRFVWLWLIVGVICLSLPREKTTRYAVLLMGAAALLMGWVADQHLGARTVEERFAGRAVWKAQRALLLVGAASPILLAVKGRLPAPWAAALTAVLLCLALYVWRRSRRDPLLPALRGALVYAVLLLGTFYGSEAWAQVFREPLRPLGKRVGEVVQGRPIFTWPDTRPPYSLLYYANVIAPVLGNPAYATRICADVPPDELTAMLEDPERKSAAFRRVLEARLAQETGDTLFAICLSKHVPTMAEVAKACGFSAEPVLDLTTRAPLRHNYRDALELIRLDRRPR